MKEMSFDELDFQLMSKLSNDKKLIYVYKKLFTGDDVYFDNEIWNDQLDKFKSILLMMYDEGGDLSSLKIIYHSDLEKQKIICNLTLNGFVLKLIEDDGCNALYKILSSSVLDHLGYN